MDMFNKASIKERVGPDIQKNASLDHLKPVEKYFLDTIKKFKIEASYDVIANELPYFKTMNYTEWAHCFIMHPLNQELRIRQMVDAYNDNAPQKIDYVGHFRDRILNGQSNKYTHIRASDTLPTRENLVVLVGSNKLKERICLNKLKWIKAKYEDDVYFKPHPLTNYQLIGELQDLFGHSTLLERDLDLYYFLTKAKQVFTSHMSESAMYAVALGLPIEPIDVYQKVEQGSFFHINKFLFTEENPKEWANRTFNSPKSGVINPLIDDHWKVRIDEYLDYISTTRNSFKNKYI